MVEAGRAAPLWVDAADWPGVVRAVSDLEADLRRVSDVRPEVWNSPGSRSSHMVLIGTIGRSAIIDQLIREGKIDASGIEGKWESFFLETVSDPLPGVESALVIVGSDKRGTIYGIYDLSEQIGVSPRFWWADVVPDHQNALYVVEGKYEQGEPSVRYRGIFLNYDGQNGNRDWEQSVRDNSRRVTTTHEIAAAGYHTLKIWMVDPAVVVQKIVVKTPAAPETSTYLGPPESYRR